MIYNYDYYRIFFYVAANRSMTAAVSRLGISTSTASRAIKALEDELGKPLFIREKHGVSLSPEGAELYARILPAMQDLIACEEQIKGGSFLPSTNVTVSVEPGILEDILIPKCLPKFYKQYPNNNVRNIDLNGDEIEQHLLSGDIDFACAWHFKLVTNRCELVPQVQLVNTPIVGEKYASLARKESVSLEELNQLPLIFMPEDFKIYIQYAQLYTRLGLNMQPALTVSGVQQQIAAVRAGLGYSFVPFIAVDGFEKEKGIYPLRLREENPDSFLSFVLYAKDRQLSPPARYLCDLLQKALSNASKRQEAFLNKER